MRSFYLTESLIGWKKKHANILLRWHCSYQVCKSCRVDGLGGSKGSVERRNSSDVNTEVVSGMYNELRSYFKMVACRG